MALGSDFLGGAVFFCDPPRPHLKQTPVLSICHIAGTMLTKHFMYLFTFSLPQAVKMYFTGTIFYMKRLKLGAVK